MSAVDGAQHVILERKAASCGADGSDRGGVSAGFHSRDPQRTFNLVLWSVLALSGEFLCFLFMTGNAHHKSLVSALFSTGNCGMAEGRCRDPAQTDKQALVRAERRQKGTTETRSRAPEGLRPRRRPLAPAHASLQTGVSL